jgi:PleD family two-component response regulator
MRQALHDPLTGLPNRMYSLERLTEAVELLGRHDHCLAVFFVDSDNWPTAAQTAQLSPADRPTRRRSVASKRSRRRLR